MITLDEAKNQLRKQVFNGGANCPCCSQFAKVYRRRINSGMVISLIRMYRRGGCDWLHIPTAIPARSREEGKLAHWELVQEAIEPRPDGGRAGYWRVTQKGEDFITKGLRVPKYAELYNGRCLRLDDSELVDIRDCLDQKFDLAELMQS